MGQITLTVEECKLLNDANDSQADRVFDMLESLNDSGVSREELEAFSIEDMDGWIHFHVRWTHPEVSSIHNSITVHVRSRGGLQMAESNLGTNGVDYVADYDSTSKAWAGINRFLSRINE